VQLIEWQWFLNPNDPRKQWLDSIQPQVEKSGLFSFRSVVRSAREEPGSLPAPENSQGASVVLSTPNLSDWLESLGENGALGWWLEIATENSNDWARLAKFMSGQAEFSTSWSPLLTLNSKQAPALSSSTPWVLAEAVQLESNQGPPFDQACQELLRWINANLWLASKSNATFSTEPGKLLVAKCRFELTTDFNLMPAPWILVGQMSLPWVSNKQPLVPFKLATDLNVDGVLKTLRSWQ
jgi:hypothetical protein